MNINADFTQRVAVHYRQHDWLESPMAGVHRKPLDRIGGEVARATSLVKYASNSQFSAHTHTGGEEFLVLDGVFEDEHGQYPAGTYVRNPPTSQHTPSSTKGCIIFVKLWQFDLSDRYSLITTIEDSHTDNNILYHSEQETVTIEKWEANANITINANKGIEILVIKGSFSENNERFLEYSWLRSPIESELQVTTGEEGATVWIKRGHLPFVTKNLSALNETYNNRK